MGTIAAPIQIDLQPVQRRTRSRGAVTSLVAWALVFFVALVAAYMAWPRVKALRHFTRQFQTRRLAAVTTPVAPQAAPSAGAQPPPDDAGNPPATEARARETPAGQAEAPPPAAPPAGSATPPALPGQVASPTVDVEQVRAQVNAAIEKACAALREQDFPAATRALDAVADIALDDQQATDRLQRWKQFLIFAQEYPGYRDQALASAAKTTATYEAGSRKIAVVEFTAKHLVYRDSRTPGRNITVPRDRIPADVEKILVAAWFAADGRAANHLFMGAAALSQPKPDVDSARRHWNQAAAGGEAAGRLLLELLDDPAVRGE